MLISILWIFKEMGIIRSTSKACYNSHYAYQATCNSQCQSSRRSSIFRLNSRELPWPTSKGYVLSKPMFDSAAWCPAYHKDINLIEEVHKRFTKCLRVIHNLSSSKPAECNHFRLHRRHYLVTWSLFVRHCTAWLIVPPMNLVSFRLFIIIYFILIALLLSFFYAYLFDLILRRRPIIGF